MNKSGGSSHESFATTANPWHGAMSDGSYFPNPIGNLKGNHTLASHLGEAGGPYRVRCRPKAYGSLVYCVIATTLAARGLQLHGSGEDASLSIQKDGGQGGRLQVVDRYRTRAGSSKNEGGSIQALFKVRPSRRYSGVAGTSMPGHLVLHVPCPIGRQWVRGGTTTVEKERRPSQSMEMELVGPDSPVVKCPCGFPAVRLNLKKSGATQGRHFYTCERRICNFFE